MQGWKCGHTHRCGGSHPGNTPDCLTGPSRKPRSARNTHVCHRACSSLSVGGGSQLAERRAQLAARRAPGTLRGARLIAGFLYPALPNLHACSQFMSVDAVLGLQVDSAMVRSKPYIPVCLFAWLPRGLSAAGGPSPLGEKSINPDNSTNSWRVNSGFHRFMENKHWTSCQTE